MTEQDFALSLAPFDEFLDPDEFTNRKEELDFLWFLADKATRRRASSYCIIARKGVGKTALMLEFYRQLFTQQKDIVPFYLSFAQYRSEPEKTQLTLSKVASIFFQQYAFQYAAFKSGKFSTPPDPLDSVSELKEFFAACGDPQLEKDFSSHLEMIETGQIESALDHAIRFPKRMTSRRREAGIVMIDEFQVLTEVYYEVTGKIADVTPVFQKPAEARWCPMVVSGSAVSLVVKTVMGGLLARRFGPFYLDPFDRAHSLELAFKLSRTEQVKLSEASAEEIHRLTGGNPYYIWCFFSSFGLKERDLSTPPKIEAVYTFETTDRKGKIRQFWDTHFNAFADKINDDHIGLQCLHQLATAKKELRISEIAAKLKAKPEHVRRVLKNLVEADLIEWQVGAIYHNIKDPILAAYIEREYQTDYAGKSLEAFIESELKRLRKRIGSAANILGETAELYTRNLMLRFDGQEVDAAEAFGLDFGKMRLPKFRKVERRTGFIIEGEAVEFDLFAEGAESEWRVEVKYHKTPAGVKVVEKFIDKLEKAGEWPIPEALREASKIWFFSRSGFTPDASRRLRELGVLHSDTDGYNGLCRATAFGELPLLT